MDKNSARKVLDAALSTGGDFAELFIENKKISSLSMTSGVLEKAHSGNDFGIGIRIFYKSQSIYSYTNSGDIDVLVRLAQDAAKAISSDNKTKSIELDPIIVENNHIIEILPSSIKSSQKVDVIKQLSKYASDYNEQIVQTRASYADSIQDVIIINSEGLYAEDRRVRTRCMIQSVAAKDNEMQIGYVAPGALKGFEFARDLDVKALAENASNIAVTMLNANHCPSGRMPVIIDNAFGGVIFHEACGHGLEATSVAKDMSIFANKIGEQVASELVTAYDDGTLPNEWGSLNIDDEGHKTQNNLLIENGILKGYLIDKFNARRMNMEATGSSRRQSYKYAPTSRMNNTYIANGNSSLDEIIANTQYGLYAKTMGGGSVNPATGEFNFSVNEGYIVENGKIKAPVRGAALIGKGIEVLQKIDMVGNNFDSAQGMCGSSSGAVPTNVGQPALRVSELTVGGRE